MSLHWWQWWWLRTVAMVPRVARVVMIIVITVFLTVSDDHNPPHPVIIIIVAGVAIWRMHVSASQTLVEQEKYWLVCIGLIFLFAFWHLLHISMVNRLVSFAFGKIWCFLCKRTTLLELTRVRAQEVLFFAKKKYFFLLKKVLFLQIKVLFFCKKKYFFVVI